MSEKLPNPYEKYGAHRSEVKVGHGLAWGLTLVFLLLCTLPPFWRNVKEFTLGEHGWTPVLELVRHDPKQGTLRDHLRETEGKIEDAEFTRPLRRVFQGALTLGLREGNRKAVIGRDGWLFFGPAISSLTGYGPLNPEPDTVARDPNREPWQGPLPAIVRFNAQLESFGVELILMPIPVKPMIYPEALTGRTTEGPISHPDAEAFYQQLRESGVEVLDLSDEWFAGKGEAYGNGQVFLKQDTHWTPEQMQATARFVAGYLEKQPWFREIESDPEQFAIGATETVEAPGDLLEKLDLPPLMTVSRDESARISPVRRADGSPMSVYDLDSPIVLLGDSFTNIFHQEDMKWGTESGFAQHLSRELGVSLDTIAQNGQASSGVRRALATRSDAAARMRDTKKVVIWAIAARDLFLSETVAREEKVTWEDFEFRSGDLAEDVEWPVELLATVIETTTFQDPKTAPYTDALFDVEYRVDQVISGRYNLDKALVTHWAFKNRERLPESELKVGDQVRLQLTGLDVQYQEDEKLRAINRTSGTLHEFELPESWALASPRLIQGAREETRQEISEEKAMRTASLVTLGYSLGLAVVILLVFRKKRRHRRVTES